MTKLTTIGYYLFIVAVLTVGIGLIGTQMPMFGGYQLRIVQSGSMEPTINTGSLVLVVPQEEYEVDNIITFYINDDGEVPTTHRIVDTRLQEGDLRYITKGDANEEEDGIFLDPDNVIGRVILDIPYLGYVLDFARTPLGFALLIGIPALIVVWDEAKNIYRELRRKKVAENDSYDDK